MTVASLCKLTGNTWKVLNYGAGERHQLDRSCEKWCTYYV